MLSRQLKGTPPGDAEQACEDGMCRRCLPGPPEISNWTSLLGVIIWVFTEMLINFRPNVLATSGQRQGCSPQRRLQNGVICSAAPRSIAALQDAKLEITRIFFYFWNFKWSYLLNAAI